MFWPKNKVRFLSFDWHCVLKVDKGWPIEWPMTIWSKYLHLNKNNDNFFLFYFFHKLNKYFQINSNPATSFGSSYWFSFLINHIILSPEKKKTYFIPKISKNGTLSENVWIHIDQNLSNSIFLSFLRIEQFETVLKCDMIDSKKLKTLAFNGENLHRKKQPLNFPFVFFLRLSRRKWHSEFNLEGKIN
jgi:hypothetical protein